MSPDDPIFDDSLCAYCEMPLPENCEPGSWAFEGLCGPACFLHCLLDTALKNRGITKATAEQGYQAIDELSIAKATGEADR